MNFLIKAKSNNVSNYKNYVLYLARRRVLFYPFRSAEVELNDYLLKNFHIDLRSACLKIIMQSNVLMDFDGTLLVKTPNKTLDNLARLITYGSGKVGGSKILKTAFK